MYISRFDVKHLLRKILRVLDTLNRVSFSRWITTLSKVKKHGFIYSLSSNRTIFSCHERNIVFFLRFFLYSPFYPHYDQYGQIDHHLAFQINFFPPFFSLFFIFSLCLSPSLFLSRLHLFILRATLQNMNARYTHK